MRDPARIPGILAALLVEWEKAPDLRLGQLLSNANSVEYGSPLFYVEDDRLIAAVQSYVASLRRVEALVEKELKR